MRSVPALGCLTLAVLCAAGPARAADPAPPAQASPDALDAQRRRLADAEDAAAKADADRRRAEGDLDALRADRARLAAALIDATARVRDAESRSAAAAERLDTLSGRQAEIRDALAARRAEIGQVLAALQRMGLHPPPALLASPDDVLRALRSSTLLGSVVPELGAAAGRLAGDLAELGRLRSLAAAERDGLARDAAALDAERARLAGLVAARQAAQAAAEGTVEDDRGRAAALARDATGLKDLVARLESEVASARRAAEAARAADEARRRAAEADAAGVAARAAAATGDPARLAPAVAFRDTKGRLSLPVAGRAVKGFGAPDGYGGQERGLTLASAPGAVVTAPADGWVSFSGPYRSYGQLLIVNMGEGYYVVLAGLARADVVAGQFVLAGEPLGAMGDGSVKTAAAIALGAGDPVLYVEFRKDGAAIDPAPWWAKAELQKVRG